MYNDQILISDSDVKEVILNKMQNYNFSIIEFGSNLSNTPTLLTEYFSVISSKYNALAFSINGIAIIHYDGESLSNWYRLDSLLIEEKPGPKSLSGDFTFTFNPSSNYGRTVTFSEEFATIPNISISISYSKNGSHTNGYVVNSVTTTDFNITIRGNGDDGQYVSGTCYWTAKI